MGPVLILKGDWSDPVGEYMRSNDIRALRLTDSFGFKGQDLSFLAEQDFLKSLEIYCWRAKGIKVIEHLPQLEVLGLQFKSQAKVDFSNFFKLRVAKLTWAKGLPSLFSVDTLEYLNVQNYPYKDLAPIEHMKQLRRLLLTSRKLESLKGIERLAALQELDLYNCQKLRSLAGTDLIPRLKIDVEACNALGT